MHDNGGGRIVQDGVTVAAVCCRHVLLVPAVDRMITPLVHGCCTTRATTKQGHNCHRRTRWPRRPHEKCKICKNRNRKVGKEQGQKVHAEHQLAKAKHKKSVTATRGHAAANRTEKRTQTLGHGVGHDKIPTDMFGYEISRVVPRSIRPLEQSHGNLARSDGIHPQNQRSRDEPPGPSRWSGTSS